MSIGIEYSNLYRDLKGGFKDIEIERLNLFLQWEKLKSEGMSEEDLTENIKSDLSNFEKDWVRSIMSVLDGHLENFKIKR